MGQILFHSIVPSLTKTRTFTFKIYRELAQCDLQSYCCLNNCLLVTTCTVKISATHSQSWRTSKAFLPNCICQLGSRSQITEQKGRTVSELTSLSGVPFMDKPIHCKKTSTPESSQTNIQITSTHTHNVNISLHPLDKEKSRAQCRLDAECV